MIPWWPSRASGFTSETTSGTSSCIRQARGVVDDGRAARRRTARAHAREVLPPAENRAMSKPSIVSSASTRTGTSAPSIVRPAERSEANGTTSVGRERAQRAAARSRSVPTAPVAPTTATLMMRTPRTDALPGSCRRPTARRPRAARARLGHAVAADDAGDLDGRRGDHLDVDALAAERREHLRGDARMRLHAGADDRDLAHRLVGGDPQAELGGERRRARDGPSCRSVARHRERHVRAGVARRRARSG